MWVFSAFTSYYVYKVTAVIRKLFNTFCYLTDNISIIDFCARLLFTLHHYFYKMNTVFQIFVDRLNSYPRTFNQT